MFSAEFPDSLCRGYSRKSAVFLDALVLDELDDLSARP
jgi:hypothetical protein